MSLWLEILVSLFLLLGCGFVLVGAIGLYRLPDFFTRLHGPTKATTLGIGGMVVASLLFFSFGEKGFSLASRKARLWDAFVAQQDKLAREAQEDFNKVFGREFMAAYQAQLRRLKGGI